MVATGTWARKSHSPPQRYAKTLGVPPSPPGLSAFVVRPSTDGGDRSTTSTPWMTIRALPRPFCKNSKDSVLVRTSCLTPTQTTTCDATSKTQLSDTFSSGTCTRYFTPPDAAAAATATRLPERAFPNILLFSINTNLTSPHAPPTCEIVSTILVSRLIWEGLLNTWAVRPAADYSTRLSSSYPNISSRPCGSPSCLCSVWSAGTRMGKVKTSLGIDDDALCPYAGARPIHQLNYEFIFPKELDGLAPRYRLCLSNLEDDECRHSDGDEDAGDEMHSWGDEETATFGIICS
ncbi:hypothetical protein L210DRAFT_3508163 [Boletus edulis BED1]|uniref:Uncharacterized protein n=1 Tax=Boletus edulis BED1 TaxID=1328754 RepID=A0AAD4BHR8_BOLED|nr:hypothetical protein L210DRAFT_3508163 [Boletus edulis BED1]